MELPLVMNFVLTNDGNSLVAVREANNGSLELFTTPVTLFQDNLCDTQKVPISKNETKNQNNSSQLCNLAPIGIINLETKNSFNEELGLTKNKDNQSNVKNYNSNSIASTKIEMLQDQLLKKSVICSENTSESTNIQLSPKKNESKINPKKIVPTGNKETCFKCGSCSQEFKTQNLMQKHMHVHAKEKPYHCLKCTASFNVPVNFTLHMATHNIGEPKCPECGRRFARLASLKAHMLTHEVDEDLYCTECGDTFSAKDQLEEHLKLHDEKWLKNERKKCKICHNQFTQPLLYRRHLQEHYKLQIKSLKMSKNGVRHKSHYKCKICLKIFEKPSQLTRHIRAHTNEKPYKCDLCNQSFTQKSSVKIHMWKHSDIKPYNCSLCNAKFTQKGNLESHVRRVHKVQEVRKIPLYRCSHCSCVFKKLRNLNIHFKRMHINQQHTGTSKISDSSEKKLKGPTSEKFLNEISIERQEKITDQKNHECEAEFSGNSEKNPTGAQTNDELTIVSVFDQTSDGKRGKYVKINQRLVNNVRFYECSYCKKHFKRPSDLIRHFRFHTQEKPFQCEVCNRKFAIKSNLNAHMKTHIKFPCLECNVFFSTEESFQTHNKKCHLKSFVCAICKKNFSTFEEIKTHSAVHNPPSKRQKRKEDSPEVQKIELGEPLVLTQMKNGLLSARPNHRNDLAHGKGRPHKCSSCPASFMKVSHLKQHRLSRHTGDKPFTCSICDRKFATKSSLKVHHRTHDLLKPYSCPLCSMSFSTLSSMRRHHVSKHSSKKPYMCPYCYKTFKAAVNCRKHMKIHKAEIFKQQNYKNQQQSFEMVSDHVKDIEKELCFNKTPHCNDSCNAVVNKLSNNETTAIVLSDNIFNEPIIATEILEQAQTLNQYIHNTGINIASNDKQAVEYTSLIENKDQSVFNLILNDGLPLLSPMITSPEASIFSQLNHFDFDQMKLLTTNDVNPEISSTNTANSNNMFEYDKALKSVKNSVKLDENQKENLSNKNINQVTNKNSETKKNETLFKDKQDKIEETINSIQQDSHKCYECNQKFLTSLKLREHIKEHVKYELKLKNSLGSNEIIIDDFEKKDKKNSVQQNKECKFCSKTFRKPSDLIRHIRTHTGERPFKCQYNCEKSFAVKSSLDSHEKVHTGEKPYRCHVCSFALSTKSGLRNHMLTHNGAKPFKCSMCDLKFRTVRQRKVHLLSHIIEPTLSETIALETTESKKLKNNQNSPIILKSSKIVSSKVVNSKTIQTEKIEFSKDKPDLDPSQSVNELQRITINENNNQLTDYSESTFLETENNFLNFSGKSEQITSQELHYLLDNGLITIQTKDSDLMPDNQLPTSTTSSHDELISKTNVLELTKDSKVIYTKPDNTVPLITESNIDFESCVLLQLDDIDSTVIIENTNTSNF